LYRICQTLSDHTLKYRIALIHLPEIARKTRDGHARIYDALAAGNASGVEDAIQSHLKLAQSDISELLKRTREETFLSHSPNYQPPKGG
jgi:DNA-binding GntR family transcriptional regulator